MKIGATFTKKRQRYECVGFHDHVNRFDRKASLVILQSRCAECGALFRFMATQTMARRGDVDRVYIFGAIYIAASRCKSQYAASLGRVSQTGTISRR
jgi:hypothetical protein